MVWRGMGKKKELRDGMERDEEKERIKRWYGEGWGRRKSKEMVWRWTTKKKEFKEMVWRGMGKKKG